MTAPTPHGAVEALLDRAHAHARAHPVLQRLAVVSRLLLAVGFIPSGLVKVLGRRFTTAVPASLDQADPIALYFEAMYRTGTYWQFLGWTQVVAGLCLLVPRTTTLGAVLFFPVILNVFVVTVALGFTGTPVVTSLMVLANLFLLAWDYDRLKAVVWPADDGVAEEYASMSAAPTGASGMPAGVPKRWTGLERSGYALGTAGALGAFLWTRTLVPNDILFPCLALAGGGGVMTLVAWFREWRALRDGAGRPS